MAQLTIIKGTTDAVTAKTEVNLVGYESGNLIANLLAGAEEADIFVNSAGTWMTLVDKDGNVQKLTATKYALVLEGGSLYAVTKDATVGACAITVDLGRGINA